MKGLRWRRKEHRTLEEEKRGREGWGERDRWWGGTIEDDDFFFLMHHYTQEWVTAYPKKEHKEIDTDNTVFYFYGAYFVYYITNYNDKVACSLLSLSVGVLVCVYLFGEQHLLDKSHSALHTGSHLH